MALVLIVMGGVLTAFLYPRSIVITVSSLNPSTQPNITSWYLDEETFSDDNMSVLLGVEVGRPQNMNNAQHCILTGNYPSEKHKLFPCDYVSDKCDFNVQRVPSWL